MKKLLALLCVISLFAGMLAGCAEKPVETGDDDEEIVTLDWFLAGGGGKDQTMVEEKLNEYLVEKLNLKLNITTLPQNDYKQVVPTVLRSGQDVGIVTVFGMDYQLLAREGAFYPITDLLDQYAPNTKKLFKDTVWEGLTCDGEIYMVPTYKDNANVMGYIYNKTMADDLGIDMSQFDTNVSVMDDEEFLMDVLAKRNAKYPDKKEVPLVNNATAHAYFFNYVDLGAGSYAITNYKNHPAFAGYDDVTVFNMYATEEYKELCLKRQRLCEAGVIAWDYKAGGYGASKCFIVPSWGYITISDHQYSKEWESVLVKFDTMWSSISSYTVAGTAIPVNCPHPEKAMQFIELLNTDPYIGTLLHFGIENVHWKKTADGDVTFEGTRNEDPKSRGYYNWYGMGTGAVTNLECAPSELVGEDGYLLKQMKYINENADMPTYPAFVFNPEPVANEIAACNNVVAEYNGELMAGHYESAADVEAALAAFLAKLEANGVQKIIDECQKQMDAYAKANG